MDEEKFLIDTNALITPHGLYYAPDLTPSFWEKLPEMLSSDRVAVLDLVMDEFRRGHDEIYCILKNRCDLKICGHEDEAVKKQFHEIIWYLENSEFYLPAAAEGWSIDTVADAWLIATAKVYGYTIVTFELRSKKLSKGAKHENAKIPDVADHFGVKIVDLFYIMRALKFSV